MKKHLGKKEKGGIQYCKKNGKKSTPNFRYEGKNKYQIKYILYTLLANILFLSIFSEFLPFLRLVSP